MRAPASARFEAMHVRIPEAGCWIWTGTTDEHYGLISIGGKMEKAHRFSWSHHCGPIPEGKCVLHRCDVPLCVNPHHLWIGTQLENIADRDTKGRQVPNHPRGVLNGMRKLTEAEVIEIRALAAGGMRHAPIGDRFGVSRGNITSIVLRRRWRHI